MNIFQDVLWGYELAYPEEWDHRTIQDVEVFAARTEALEGDYAGPQFGQMLVKAEWNCARRPIRPLWSRHIGMLSGMLSARRVGSAPWQMAGAAGLEAEVVLPKQDNRRLWTGILSHDFLVLHFMVTHYKEDRNWFEPLATQIISSLRFLQHVDGTILDEKNIPLPPSCTSIPPNSIIPDILDPQNWRAYEGRGSVSALQAFYLRELPYYKWRIEEYVPFPSPSDLGFARLQIHKGEQDATLGILPYDSAALTPSSPARIVLKYRW